ncbi:MAG: 5-(carboxyamino)imidazole ribonucleotide synthase [Anaerolineae bacterium]|nr:5-(carboxyamino)imidazole ribonucleotide synthase [Anaerolineae bacterium]
MTRLGILGGGQLAQMMTQAAISLGIETAVLERTPDSPASRLTHHHQIGDWNASENQAFLADFAALCDVVTLENEFVPPHVLEALAAFGPMVYPTAETLYLIRDKLTQKQIMAQNELPLPAFAEVQSPQDIQDFIEAHGLPAVLKARTNGYDGYGNATIHAEGDIVPALDKLSNRVCYVESFVPFVRELAVMILRGRDGEIRAYPVVETVQHNHICHIVRAPAPIAPEIAERAQIVAIKAVEAVNGVGVFGVELFLLENGEIVYNEIAPRPHNSGHYTIEGCITSQFENHIRAVLGWPLGSTDMIAPAAVMVNLLGKRDGLVRPQGIKAALAIPAAHVHIYGKRESRIGRKMGHVTVVGESIEQAERLARQAADLVDL